MNIYLSSAYLPPIQYFSKMLMGDTVYIETAENYVKQTYRNRCAILSANGVLSLSIPIESMGGQKSLMKDIRISDHGNWQHLHWNALISAYKSTPFFEYYEDDFRPFYEKKQMFLFDFNEELRALLCGLIGLDSVKFKYTTDYLSQHSESDNDYRSMISPKVDYNIADFKFESTPYYQVFDQRFGFTPNLSIVDLLFNMGNESLIVLEKCIKAC